ncbi:MAG: hypothetical protein HFF20_07860 [Oscillospiraceae bacterium]|nr:hypothetical protein [Oscillospiraceae bacterium]MCI9308952.1 hypothetical protein [Oscillospiraceae bacterium]MCI9549125.1 hypothetical protein [Oscillospiraceae bacterium]
MKRMVFGVLLAVIGFVLFAFCLIHALLNPVTLNGVGGLLSAFISHGTLVPFVLSTAVMCAGLAICGWEAFRKDK